MKYPDTAKWLILDFIEFEWSFNCRWNTLVNPKNPVLYLEGSNGFDSVVITYTNSGHGYRYRHGIVNTTGNVGYKEMREFIRHHSAQRVKESHLKSPDYINVPMI